MNLSIKNEKLLAHFEAERNSPMQQSFAQGNQRDPASGMYLVQLFGFLFGGL